MYVYGLVCALAACFGLISASDLVIRAEDGSVKGRSLLSYSRKNFRAFQAIPYAKSTAGHKRFTPPEPVDGWDGVLDATKFGQECPQFNFVTRGVEGDEDCLTINVYTPWVKERNETLPVMVFIHGGGFVIGTGTYPMYPPEKLMDYDVVFVTFNYRLGVLGFLNTEDDQAYGNYGMLDQVLALKWVQKNIEHFGGNRNRVTIFGESAGSASVTYHYLSPLSKGLFRGAIAQSGAATGNWALAKQPLEVAHRVAEKVQCPTDSTKELIRCFREKSIYEIIYGDRQTRTGFFPHSWAPSVEASGGPGFLTDDPKNLIMEKKISNRVPLIAGVNSDEGYLFLKEFLAMFASHGAKRVDELPAVLSHMWNKPPNYEQVYSAIREHYYGGPNMDNNEVFEEASVKLFTDMSFGPSVSFAIDRLSEAGVPVYAYRFTHITEYSLAQMFRGSRGKYSSHGDEMMLQFPFVFTQYTKMNENDTKMAFIINSLWTSFVNTLNPSVVTEEGPIEWRKHTKTNPQYLELTLNKPGMRKGVLSEETTFWMETVPNIAKNTQTPKTEL